MGKGNRRREIIDLIFSINNFNKKELIFMDKKNYWNRKRIDRQKNPSKRQRAASVSHLTH